MSITPDRRVPSAPAVTGMAVTIQPSLAHLGDLRIHLAGELDCWSGPVLVHALVGLRPPTHVPGQHPSEVVLDLHELRFLDSSGLRALETSRTDLLAAGWLVKAGPAQPQVRRLLRFVERAGWLAGGPLVPEDSPTNASARHADAP